MFCHAGVDLPGRRFILAEKRLPLVRVDYTVVVHDNDPMGGLVFAAGRHYCERELVTSRPWTSTSTVLIIQDLVHSNTS